MQKLTNHIKKAVLSIFILLLVLFESRGQNTFHKIIDYDGSPQNGMEVVKYNDEFIIHWAGICQNDEGKLLEPCCGVVVLDSNATTINRKIIKKFSTGLTSMIIDTMSKIIFLSGEPIGDYGNHRFMLNKLSLDDLDHLSSDYFSSHDKNQIDYSQILTKYKDKSLFIIGSGIDSIKNNKNILILKITEGILDTSAVISLGESTTVWSSLINKRQNLVLSFEVREKLKDYYYTIEYNDDFVPIRQVVLGENKGNIWPRICELENGNLVMTVSEDKYRQIASILCIDSLNNKVWHYNFPFNSNQIQRQLSQLKVLKNGDILGVGYYGNLGLNLNTKISAVPYIFRMTSNGKLLWEKAFYRETTGNISAYGDFKDFVELETGDLFVVGKIANYLDFDPIVQLGRTDLDLFVVRMNAQGCIDDKCEFLTNVTPRLSGTDEGNFDSLGDVVIYPNPADKSFYLKNNSPVKTIIIRTLQGTQLKKISEPPNEISTSELIPGTYFINIQLDNGEVIVKKLIKY